MIYCKFDVYFEDPFWVGLFQRVEQGKLTVSKVTFGPEPKEGQIQEFLLKNYNRLIFSPSIDTELRERPRTNPKRMQREISRSFLRRPASTKSQEALKLLQQEGKELRKRRHKEARAEMEKEKFLLKQQKKKQKSKGH